MAASILDTAAFDPQDIRFDLFIYDSVLHRLMLSYI